MDSPEYTTSANPAQFDPYQTERMVQMLEGMTAIPKRVRIRRDFWELIKTRAYHLSSDTLPLHGIPVELTDDPNAPKYEFIYE